MMISIVDYKEYCIPDCLTFALLLLGLIYRGIYLDDLEGMMVGTGVITIPFLLLYGYVSELLKKEVLGFGDIKLAMGIGSMAGGVIVERFYHFYLIAFVSASIYGIALMVIKKERCGMRIPMAPFISLAGIWICL